MRLTLIGIASKYIHQNLAPWCLKAGLLQYGVKSPCKVLELNINQPIDHALEKLMATRPQLAGFSVYIWNVQMVRSLAASLKLLSPKTVIVLGGPEAGSRPESIMKEIPEADYVISGPGEYAFAELCKKTAAGEDVSTIPGLTYRKPDGFSTNPPAQPPLPPPDPYTKECLRQVNGRIAYVETSRGCPFHCTFCLSGREESVSFLPLDAAKKRLVKAAASGAKTIKLVDRTFNCHRERALALFRFLIRKHQEGAFIDVCFHFEVAADLFDEKTLDLLKTAPPGLFQMEAGLQSFHAKTLHACQRKTDIEKLSRNITSILLGHNIHLHLDLIAGLPYEDFHTFGDSVNKALSLQPHMLQLGFLKLLHASRMREQSVEFGIVHRPEPPYEILKSKWLSFDDLCCLKKCEEALDRLYNSGRFRRTLDLVFTTTGIPPFQLFCQLGEIFQRQEGGLSLDQCTSIAFDFFNGLPGISQAALRDAMAHDRLVNDNTGRLPECLLVADDALGRVIRDLRKQHPEGSKLGVCMLYDGGKRVLCADYSRRDPVTFEYAARILPL